MPFFIDFQCAFQLALFSEEPIFTFHCYMQLQPAACHIYQVPNCAIHLVFFMIVIMSLRTNNTVKDAAGQQKYYKNALLLSSNVFLCSHSWSTAVRYVFPGAECFFRRLLHVLKSYQIKNQPIQRKFDLYAKKQKFLCFSFVWLLYGKICEKEKF